MTFLAVVSSQLPSSNIVCPVFFVNSATIFFHSGVTPSWMVSPGAERPLPCPPPSDATGIAHEPKMNRF